MSENNSDNQQIQASLASSILSPDTERAVQDLMTTSNGSVEQSNQQQHEQSNQNQNNFDNLQKAVQILAKAKQLDEFKRYDDALKLYRQGVDMLLEELIIRQGTEQSRSYLRDKCNDFMNRIDQLKLIIQIEKAENKENEVKG